MRRGLRRTMALALLASVVGTVVAAQPSYAHPSYPHACSWPTSVATQEHNASALAAQAVSRMTLSEKVDFLGLSPEPQLGIEQANPGVPGLCIPPLTLRDGPVGVAYDATGVTAFPSELSLAASFDTPLAVQYGSALGTEARAQGNMGIQGPGLDVQVFDNWGRGYENLGSDPALTSTLGAALVQGIQRTGEFSMAKHLGAYVQESGRGSVNALVSARALHEVFLAPFRSASRAGADAFMCAMGRTNGVADCSDGPSVTELRQDGFTGFIRSDAGAASDEVNALEQGVDLFRPFDPDPVEDALADGSLPVSVLDGAVRRVLTEMFRAGDVADPVAPDFRKNVATRAATATSLAVAEQSMVLLKDRGVLPISTAAGSIAVIGAAAQQAPIAAGTGSSWVHEDHPVTDLSGIMAVAPHQPVWYTPAATTDGQVALPLGPVTEDPTLAGYQTAPLELPTTMSGLVDFSYATTSATQLSVDGSTLLQNYLLTSGLPVTFEKSLELAPGTHAVTLVWPDGTDPPTVTAQDVDPILAAAAASAREARTAIVDVGVEEGEGYDRGTLALPGYDDQLIEAVAAANPRTVVVVHSGGPVLMPWLSKVAGVVEAWYPGEVAGTALGAVLSGMVDPSGRLPISIPTSDATAPMIPAATWPTPVTTEDLVGLGDLGIGSRWDAAHGTTPQFPFGFGLSYTRFALSSLTAHVAGAAIDVTVRVANVGTRAGRDTGLVDVTFPSGAGEPSGELKAFGGVSVAAGRTATLAMRIPLSSLQVWRGAWQLVAGIYRLSLGALRTSVTLTG
jgi:beta-glucosidase